MDDLWLYLTTTWYGWGMIATTILFLAFIIYIITNFFLRTYIASALATYVIINDEGFKRVLDKGSHTLWNPNEWVFKGEIAPKLCFKIQDPNIPESVTDSHCLLNRANGRINLKIQSLECPIFTISTQDNKVIPIRAEISFQLDRKILKFALMYQDFGSILRARIEAAFRAAISKHGDEDISFKKEPIIKEVKEYLNKPEIAARKKEEANEVQQNAGTDQQPEKTSPTEADSEEERTPLGVKFIDIGYHIEENYKTSKAQVPPQHIKITPAQVQTTSEEGEADKPEPNKQTPEAELPVHLVSAARNIEDIDIDKLDSIRDVFLRRDYQSVVEDTEAHYQEANEKALRILELQADIIKLEALIASSGPMMILSSEEMGLKNLMLREPMRKLMQDFFDKKTKEVIKKNNTTPESASNANDNQTSIQKKSNPTPENLNSTQESQEPTQNNASDQDPKPDE